MLKYIQGTKMWRLFLRLSQIDDVACSGTARGQCRIENLFTSKYPINFSCIPYLIFTPCHWSRFCYTHISYIINNIIPTKTITETFYIHSLILSIILAHRALLCNWGLNQSSQTFPKLMYNLNFRSFSLSFVAPAPRH